MSNKYRTNSTGKRDKSLIEIIYILYRRKYIIISSVIIIAALAVIYSYMVSPVYRASALLKKETVQDSKSSNEFYEIVKMQTQDEIETEIELVKTGDVLGNVVNDLNLFMSFKKFVTQSGEEFELEKSTLDYNNPKLDTKTLPSKLPNFIFVKLKKNKSGDKFYIEKVSKNEIGLFNAETDKLIQSRKTQSFNVDSNGLPIREQIVEDSNNDSNSSGANNFIDFNSSVADIRLSWDGVPVGTKFYFDISSYLSTITNLGKKISVERKGKTNIFEVSVNSSSPYSAALLANSVIEKFRESRIEQKKQTIRYSFGFIDEQLQQMQLKLREAEDNLSRFKASGQITTIDASSTEVIKFLSSLETAKMNTELELTGYKKKIEDMQNELETSGYFDQSFLSPEGTGSGTNPFSTLLTQISNLELKKLELLQKRTEDHPDVININQQIELAKEKLASYNQNTLTAYEIIVNSLDKKLVDISNMMSKYEVKLERLPGQENILARLIREKDVYEKMFTLLLDKREEMRLAELSKLQDIVVVDAAKEPLGPISPRKMMNVFIGIVLGGLIGIIGIFLVELKNSKLVDLDEIEEEFQIPIFALIPSYSKKIRDKIETATDSKDKFVTLIDEQDGFRESFRLLKTKIRIHSEGRDKVFMITSCEENTGKTTIAANLALSIAQENQRVLLIDCDLRKAQLSKMFGMNIHEPGLIDFLSKDVAPSIYTSVLKRLDVLPTGGISEDSSHLLNSERMKLLFNSFDASIYNYIIVDTPPVTRVVDTLVLGRYIRDALLVVRPSLSYSEAVWGGIQEMIQAKIKIRGLIANGAEIKQSYYYRYRYGYGYGYSDSDKFSKKNRRTERSSPPIQKVNLKSLSGT